jgi:hypothetical protein
MGRKVAALHHGLLWHLQAAENAWSLLLLHENNAVAAAVS